jgi:nucleoside 2-deoxyribosyltransferase
MSRITDLVLYLCGPMTGIPDYNRPAFSEAERALTAAGYKVVNPASNGLPADSAWLAHMRRDIANLVTQADAVATLPGSRKSRGAAVEITLALGLGIPVWPVWYWLSKAAEAEWEDER